MIACATVIPATAEADFLSRLKKTAADCLPPTGLTIGGPGTFEESGQGRVYDTNDIFDNGVPPDVCITVLNKGNALIEIVVPGNNPPKEVDPGQTRTNCYEEPEKISLNCIVGTCKAIWRVDLVREETPN